MRKEAEEDSLVVSPSDTKLLIFRAIRKIKDFGVTAEELSEMTGVPARNFYASSRAVAISTKSNWVSTVFPGAVGLVQVLSGKRHVWGLTAEGKAFFTDFLKNPKSPTEEANAKATSKKPSVSKVRAVKGLSLELLTDLLYFVDNEERYQRLLRVVDNTAEHGWALSTTLRILHDRERV